MPGGNSYQVIWFKGAREALKTVGGDALKEEIARIVRLLDQRLRTEPLLVGEVYRSKGAIQEHLAVQDLLAIDIAIDTVRKLVAVRHCEILQQESERLRELASACKKREEYESEMRANYPHFKRMVYDLLKEKALREVPELPENVDLLAYAKEHGVVPFETVIAGVERVLKGE